MLLSIAILGATALVASEKAIPDNSFAVDRSKTKEIEVRVAPDAVLGTIRDVNGVNNGPQKSAKSQCRSNFEAYKAARIPFARTHDAAFSGAYGFPGHMIDIACIFPNFDADENDPKNYDFYYTDYTLDNIEAAGTKVYYRLGQSIEHGGKKYHVRPQDFAKWARICEHVIAHCNEGWANGKRRGIEYWEIWNEPDNNPPENPTCWRGTDEEFRDFFATAYTHLKKRFPTIKLGGPAIGWNEEYAEAFLKDMQARGIKLDFFSWHGYATDPREISARARRQRERMDKYGQSQAESHLGEWNYVPDWGLGWTYSMRCESGDRQHIGAAFTAATLTELQNNSDVAIAKYYDARPGTSMNGLFHAITCRPMATYYALFAWSELKALGTQVAARAMSPENDVYVTAAKGEQGGMGVYIVRFDHDQNVIMPRRVRLHIPGVDWRKVRAYMTDYCSLYTFFRPELEADGSASFALEPNAFVYLEW